MCTGALTQPAWQQACLSTAAGGLGLRSAQRHSPAAYLASLAATEQLCLSLDPAYSSASLGGAAARDAYNLEVSPADRLPDVVPPQTRQRELSQALDRAVLARLAAPGPGLEAFRAHLQLLQQHGAGAWLHAPPSEALGLHVAPALFKIMVQLRLRLPVASADEACPLCDGVADSFGDHARCCACGGDRTKRHNRLRSVLASRARAAGLGPEVEKADLLPPRLDEHGAAEDGVRRGSGRRPADVWVGNWGLHGPAAFDFAVTSGMRLECLRGAVVSGGRPAADYEAKKRTHLQTAEQCEAAGLQFLPLVAEACGGGWAATAVRVWKELGRLLSAKSGEAAAVETDKLLQSLAVTLQRENARAVLRRLPLEGAAGSPLADP